ncbi:uncharacterized protein [Palaemon carinicauda]|uniref:uncharacterized protein n=1 Tax=Palaemon carinicauda TaxID=392227 RepID=UPI0035B5AE92
MPLVHAFTRQSDDWSSRQRRHLSAVAKYDRTIHHFPGKMNPVAEPLSRNTLAAVQLRLDYNTLAEAQLLDPEYQACRTSCLSLSWEDIPLDDSNANPLCDVSTGRPRPWIHTPVRRQVFDFIHGLSHPSCCSTAQRLKTKFIWHGISKDAKDGVRASTSCQTSKVHRHTD